MSVKLPGTYLLAITDTVSCSMLLREKRSKPDYALWLALLIVCNFAYVSIVLVLLLVDCFGLADYFWVNQLSYGVVLLFEHLPLCYFRSSYVLFLFDTEQPQLKASFFSHELWRLNLRRLFSLYMHSTHATVVLIALIYSFWAKHGGFQEVSCAQWYLYLPRRIILVALLSPQTRDCQSK